MNEHKQKRKLRSRTKEKATSRNNFNFIFLRVLYLFVTQKMHKAYFGGKQANCANFSKENLLRQDKYQCPREANLKKQKLITSLLQTIVEGQMAVWINPTLWCFSGCCSNSPFVLQSKECVWLEIKECS